MTNKVTVLKRNEAEEMIPYDGGAVKTNRIVIVVDGRTPLLTHSPQAMGATKGPGKESRIPTPEVESEGGCYRREDGSLCIKGDSFRGSLIGAASAWKKKGKATMKSTLTHCTVTEELIPLKHKDGSPVTSYE